MNCIFHCFITYERSGATYVVKWARFSSSDSVIGPVPENRTQEHNLDGCSNSSAYATDLTEAKRNHLAPMVRAAKLAGGPAKYARREIVNGIFVPLRISKGLGLMRKVHGECAPASVQRRQYPGKVTLFECSLVSPVPAFLHACPRTSGGTRVAWTAGCRLLPNWTCAAYRF